MNTHTARSRNGSTKREECCPTKKLAPTNTNAQMGATKQKPKS
jgi:hypothetical protein